MKGVRWLVLVVLFLGLLETPALPQEDLLKKEYPSPAEIFQIVEESKILYEIHGMDDLEGVDTTDLAGALYGRRDALVWPSVAVDKSGARQPSEYAFGDKCVELLLEAEPFFDAKEYDKAEKIYRKATRTKDCFLAFSHVGDCHYFRGENKEAIKWYDKAIKKNPAHPGTAYLKGNALRRLGRFEEARNSYIESLVLRPRKEVVAQTLQKVDEEMGVVYFDTPFRSKVFVKVEKDKVLVYVDVEESQAYWMAFALCKAIWMGEPGYKKNRAGADVTDWTLVEEKECLAATASSYRGMLEEGKTEKSPQMERVIKAAERGLINGYILYEIASIYTPDSSLFLDEDSREEIRKYVDALVLPVRPPGPWQADFP